MVPLPLPKSCVRSYSRPNLGDSNEQSPLSITLHRQSRRKVESCLNGRYTKQPADTQPFLDTGWSCAAGAVAAACHSLRQIAAPPCPPTPPNMPVWSPQRRNRPSSLRHVRQRQQGRWTRGVTAVTRRGACLSRVRGTCDALPACGGRRRSHRPGWAGTGN